ncbi:head completion/stabilization protein [Pseudomonas entomophila]|jgi:hypothetical protein|uniref:head completion/stabilization protein n=1 Tax=Pseudomonas entomophila TaxID=312306 RepID=UPI0015E34265|nr:head completion/stabilization protein [Pseudomonas entomophila]MBA1191486.1 head completion/stabilization protein [Pseudomonas entomophila]
MHIHDTGAATPLQERLVGCDDPFWPRISLSALRRHLTLSIDISEARLEVAAHAAVLKAADAFAQWRHRLRAHGIQRLQDLERHTAGRRLTHCYLRCVELETRNLLRSSLAIRERSSAH